MDSFSILLSVNSGNSPVTFLTILSLLLERRGREREREREKEIFPLCNTLRLK